MCGFHVIIGQPASVRDLDLHSWASSSRYRGPDSEGRYSGMLHPYLYFSIVAFRLRIASDNPADDQPILAEDGRFCLVYNGEVYNAQSLVRKKCRENTESLTEPQALMLLLREYGTAILPELEGMFALVFIDTVTGNAWAARDRFGIKPMFIVEHDCCIILSSTQSALLELPVNTAKHWNTSGLLHYVRYYFTNGEQSLWHGVKALGAGICYNAVTKKKRPFAQRTPPNGNDRAFDAEKANDLLAEALEAMWPKSGDPTLLYSGGYDSGLLLWVALKILGKKPHLLLLNTGTEEATKAQKLAAKLDIPCTILDVFDEATPDEFQQFISSIDYPVGDSGFFLHYLACKAAKKNGKILLSGAGADELTGGYRRHQAWRSLSRVPAITLLAKTAETMRLGGRVGYAANVLGYTQLHRADALTERAYLYGNQRHQLQESLNPLDYDQDNYLPYNVLALADQSCSLQQTEIRLPFLHAGISEYYQSFECSTVLRSPSKWMIRAQWNALGEQPLSLSKQGFGLPDIQWLTQLTLDKPLSSLFSDTQLEAHFISTFGLNPLHIPHRHAGQHAWAMYMLGSYMNRNALL